MVKEFQPQKHFRTCYLSVVAFPQSRGYFGGYFTHQTNLQTRKKAFAIKYWICAIFFNRVKEIN